MTRYAPYFCEENVWHLAQDAAVPVDDRHVVFVTNRSGTVAMRHQRAGDPVVWDYHVVMLGRRRPPHRPDGLAVDASDDAWSVWDQDTTLPFPSTFAGWLASFPPRAPTALRPWFRVVDAAAFVGAFASDRSHMVDADGSPLRPFPPWPPIGAGMTLPRFLDLDDAFVGEVLDLPRFTRRFSSCVDTSTAGA